jgi:hypothetical protein
MKDQYFGDVNDYRNTLSSDIFGRQIRTGICWMLTGPDQRTDGQVLGYLQRPRKFRAIAPDLFDFLHHCVIVQKVRRVARLEQSGLLPNAVFHSTPLRDDRRTRAAYFTRMRNKFAHADWIFFDPDNGLEVPSTRKGRKGSSKYLFMDEVVQTFRAGHSVLVYQHFPRQAREQYITRLAQALTTGTGTCLVISFRTSRAVFLLAAQPKHNRHFRTLASELPLLWGCKQIIVTQHRGQKSPC